MESPDDPEARIRDLERPLADRAHASELGIHPPATDALPPPVRAYADPYPPPPPMTAPLPPMPPPVDYEAPYPGPVRHSNSGLRGVWLIVAGVFIVGAVALATSISAISEMFSDINSGDDTPAAAPPISIDVPPVWPGAPDTSVPPTAPEPTVVASGAQLSISGVGGHRSVVCDGGTISVSGVDNTVELTGHCVNVTVSGVRNVVSIDSVDVVEVSGFDNRVTYRSGSPEIGQSGGGNSVERG